MPLNDAVDRRTVSDEPSQSANRREFLTGKAIRSEIENAGGQLADRLTESVDDRAEPCGGDTIRLATEAMACEFSVLLNPAPENRLHIASDALDLVHQLEDQMSVYREHSELSELNRQAFDGDIVVEEQLFLLLRRACELCCKTEGAFDPTSGPLIALWRECRSDGRIPTEAELEKIARDRGVRHVEFNDDNETQSIRFHQRDIRLDLGGIGKGYALDRAGQFMVENGLNDWLIHGGHSSILARGDHNNIGGWPVGIRNPLFPKERLATVLLRDCGFSSSGSGTQHFRQAGKRYGHILDPRTGWPVDGMLSVSVIAPIAAEADALSTAFFVLGLENTRRYCDNHPEISALLIPTPRRGRTLEPVVCGIPDEVLFFNHADVPTE